MILYQKRLLLKSNYPSDFANMKESGELTFQPDGIYIVE